MATEILMPALSPTMEEGTLAKWMVKEGDTVSSGDILAEIETDKATMEFEAVDEGTIGKILIAEGTEGVAVNTAIAVLLEEGDDASAIDSVASAPAPVATAEPAAPVAPSAAAAPAPVVVDATPDWAEGTEVKSTTVREALRDAMAEEMRRDDSVFLMGEEVAEYQGAYKISQGMLDEFGAKRVYRYADHRARLCGYRHRCGLWRSAPDRRVHDIQLCHARRLITSSTLRPRHSICRVVRWGPLWCSVVQTVLRPALAHSTLRTTPHGICRCRASRL